MAQSKSRQRFMEAHPEGMPRERFRDSEDPRSLPDEWLLAILLRTGFPGCDVLELAKRLIEAFCANMELMVKSDWRTIERRIEEWNSQNPDRKIERVKEEKIIEIAAAFELSRRGWQKKVGDWKELSITAGSASKAVALFREQCELEKSEGFWVLPLNARHHPIHRPLRIASGTVDSVSVHTRDVFTDAVRWGAQSLIVAHNHPDGDPAPSEEDIILTRALLDAAQLLSIPLLDHIIIGAPGSGPSGNGYTSIRATGAIEF